MLSPALASPPQPHQSHTLGSNNTNNNNLSPTSRRRGLSYLRSLSTRDHSASLSSTDSPTRTLPRHFFVRSTSYQETNLSGSRGGRRRSQSHSRPIETTATTANELPVPESLSLARVISDQGTQPTSGGSHPTNVTTDTEPEDMTRTRPSTSRRQTTDALPEAASMERTASGNARQTNGESLDSKQGLPTLRMFPHQDHNRIGRPSLNFSHVSRTLPNEGSIIRVGRYSEREGPPLANPIGPSDAPVGFKSKVVSRKHCEFSFADGHWNIRDVASSSGTFLNHIRLSQPNQESRLYPVKDGDIVQLGIDFRGGEEMIFRCVKIRIECNRSWQKKPNMFNKQRQAQLRGLAKDQPAAGANSGECSICLGNVLPCQALFVAPCAHVWHYKCIRPMLEGRSSQYPQFQCPNCRAYSDLEADVDVDMEEWAEDDDEESADQDKDLGIDQADRPDVTVNSETVTAPSKVESPAVNGDLHEDVTQLSDAPNMLSAQSTPSNSSLLSRRNERDKAVSFVPNNNTSISSPMNSIPLPARPTEIEMQDHLAQQRTQTDSPNGERIIAGEGPLTPRNNAGPFVFDGSGSQMGSSRRNLNVPSHNLDEVSDGIE